MLRDVIDAVVGDDVARLRELIARDPSVAQRINDPAGPFDSPAVIHARSREALDALLDAGADLDARSRWWAGGFGLLDMAPPDVAAYAIERGATVDAHAAARLGLVERLRELLGQNPALVHARGGDGQTPLHMASTIEVADALIDAGADLDARDVDHESTPAQYMVEARHGVARHLVSRGCETDLLLVAALGDAGRVGEALARRPGSIAMRVDEQWFPKRHPKAGGTIYNWTLGFHASAHEAARRFGHEEVLELLFERTPAAARVVEACWIEDEARAGEFAAKRPPALAFSEPERRLLAHAARNNKTAAVRLMLRAGLPADARGQHQATPLHWAAFHGNAEMVETILRADPPLEATDADFRATPLGWAIHGSEHGWHRHAGDYGRVVELLLRAGAARPSSRGGSAAVRDALRHGQDRTRT